MLTGIIPFDGHDHAETLSLHTNGHIPNPRDVNASVTPAMAQLMTKLMIEDPEDRYATWSNVLADIKKISANRILSSKSDRTRQHHFGTGGQIRRLTCGRRRMSGLFRCGSVRQHG